MSANSENPLLGAGPLPAFSRIRPEHVLRAVDEVLAEGRRQVARVLKVKRAHTWESLAQPLEEVEDRIHRTWSPVSHLHAVADNPKLREAFNTCLPKLSEFASEIGHNRRLFKAYRGLAEGPLYASMDQAQKRSIQNSLRDFRLSGVDLARSKKARHKAICVRLSELSSKFAENVLDATQGWKKHVTDEAVLAGLPATARQFARDTAEREGLPGWLLTLEAPSYLPVLSHVDDRALRQEMYEASTTRASDRGPNARRWDNSVIMEEILALRHEKARLLDFQNYAQYSLATKMAPGTREVLDFLGDLARRAKPVAQAELEALRSFAHQKFGMSDLQAWDIPYYSEKLRQERYAISQEELRAYFPLASVLDGLFAIVEKLYGLEIRETHGVETWHDDVRFFCIHQPGAGIRGQFYLDLYSRPHKRGGAWMDECVVRKKSGVRVHTPVAYLTCNFMPPGGDKPALLTHEEVTTLFHEFGHGLHHMLTLVDHPSVAGINGVEWDAVELPSQFMENWCWEREALALVSRHFRTGKRLPRTLYDRLRAARNFQSGLAIIRQIEFALFDFRLHLEFDPDKALHVEEALRAVRDEVAVIHPPAFNRFAHSFSHIFGGGYAAGYYSYLWAEVLSSDAFSRFEENGVFDRQTGLDLLHAILEQGGSRTAMESFVAFRGREPDINALLRHCGITDAQTQERVA